MGKYDIALLGVDETHPVVQQVRRAMAEPDLRGLFDRPVRMQCSLYSQVLFNNLDDPSGWEFCLLLAKGDYHVNLRHGDVVVDLAPGGDPTVRLIVLSPRAQHDAAASKKGGSVTYSATFEGLVPALVDAGFLAGRGDDE